MALKRFKPYESGRLVGETSPHVGLGRRLAEFLTLVGDHESCEADRVERIAAAPARGAKRKTIRPKHGVPLDNSWDSKPQTEVHPNRRQALRGSHRHRRFLRASAQSRCWANFEERHGCIRRRRSRGRGNAAPGQVLCTPRQKLSKPRTWAIANAFYASTKKDHA
jgi:hypothetical protein